MLIRPATSSSPEKTPGDVGMADEGMRTGHRKKCRDKLGWLLHVISEEVFGQGLFRRGVNQQVITVVIQEGVGLHEVEKRLPSGRHRWVVVVSSRFELRSVSSRTPGPRWD